MHHGTTGSVSPLLQPISLRLCDVLLVASLTKTLSDSGTRNLDPNSIPISEPLVLQILTNNSLEPSRKLAFFRWCFSLSPRYNHSSAAYSQILRTVCRTGFLVEVPSLLDSVKRDGIILDSGVFKVLLDSYIRSGKFDSAIDILDYMEELGTNLNLDVYDSVLIALIRKNQVGLALSIFYKLIDSADLNSGSISGSAACNALMVALRKSDMKVEFRTVYDKLRKKKDFEFDTWGYNICIHAFGCWGDLGSSLNLFKEMKEKSSLSSSTSLAPDLCTYNSMIHVLCLTGKVKDALIVWEELKVSGHEPDAFTYRIIIQMCCKAYLIDDATQIFSQMQYNGFLPDTVVYNSMLDGMLKAKKVNEACLLFEKMVEDGVRATCWTYNILIDGLFKNGRVEAGYTLFCDLKKKGQFVDGVTYSIVVLQHCKEEGQLEEALRLVEEMEGKGFDVDLVTITSLLIGFHKQGRWELTDRLMKHVREGNLVPNVLKWKADIEASMKTPQSKIKDFTSMFPSESDFCNIKGILGSSVEEGDDKDQIDEWSSSPHMDRLARRANTTVDSLFPLNRAKRVQEKGFDSFDADMVNTFLSIFLSKGNLSLACKLFEIFSDMGFDPVGYTYNSMMSSFVKKGYFKEARGILDQMGEKFCLTDIATYNVVIQGLGKMGRADLAGVVLDKLTKDGGYLDIVMYNTLINALGKAGRVGEAKKLFQQMKKNGINPDVVTYNTLIEVHSKAGKLKEAYRYLKMMLDMGCSPNYVTDTILDYLGNEMEKLRYQKASFVRRNKED